MNTRLTEASLATLDLNIARPQYDRRAIGIGIVHLGTGAFHRAHQADYTEDVLNEAGGDWGIMGISLRRPAVRDQLQPQNGLYTLVEQSNDSERLKVIGAIKSVLVAPEAPMTVIKAMAKPSIQIVSLTITEKGYCHNPATGSLNETHPDIIHDLENPQTPRTALGFIVAAIRCRRSLNIPLFTLLCCDNLPKNGKLLHNMVLRFAELLDPGTAQGLDGCLYCPSSVVDRIVPATVPGDIEKLQQKTGLLDAGMVKAEPFRQWVIEDNFSMGRPAWEAFGANFVADVTPYEKAKLRLLNGSHSTLACLGYLAGYTYIHEAMATPAFVEFIRYMMRQEVEPSLDVPTSFDLRQYQHDLCRRFSNAALNHQTYQVAMDGSQKLPQRLLHTVRHQLTHGGSIDAHALAISAWMRYVTGVDEQGQIIEVQDPLADMLQRCYERAGRNPVALVKSYLDVQEVFAEDLAADKQLINRLNYWLSHLFDHGAAACVRLFVDRLG